MFSRLDRNCRNGGGCKFDKLNDFRKRGLFFDVTFVVGGEELRAHKNVLSARSEVFETMFTTCMTEATLGVVNITDATKEAFEAFIQFLYSDIAKPEVIDEHYVELIYLSDKYLVESLTSKCVDRLSSTLHCRNLVEMLEISKCFKLLTLQQKLYSYLIMTGNDFINSSDFEKLVGDFRFSEMVMSSVIPTTKSESIIISPEFWNQNGGLKWIEIRNNGHIVELGIRFKHRRKTLYCSLELEGDHTRISWPVELSFKFSLSRTDGSLVHSGQGNVWWEPNFPDFEEWEKVEEERRRELFEYCHQSRLAVVHLKFVFNITLSQWCAPGRFLNKRKAHESGYRESKDGGESVEVVQSKVDEGITSQSDIDQSSLLSALKEEEDSTCSDNTLANTSILALHQYVSSGLFPDVSEVNASLIRGAHKFSMGELVAHCEKAIAFQLNSKNVVEFIILARQLELNKLEDTAVEFINLHHLEVMASKGWPLLKDYPEIVAKLLKKMLKSPEEVHEKLPIPPGISDSESSDSSFRAMEHSVESDG
ncbi:hypothetical protein GE061_019146 [Apolygus lucorum]|uniref:Uncharacterized protein n=1 Tax=Apolygus lucorum TaxID=248454 RepID=A0A6A4JGF5_APOLU|nr:hypothetical protein GE061_019146 [Apolygus lucorum]